MNLLVSGPKQPGTTMPRAASVGFFAVLVLGMVLPCGSSMALTAKEMQSNCHELTSKAKSAGGNQLDIPNTPGALVCFGFFSAVQRFTVFQREGERQRIFNICAPPQTTLLQLIELFQRYVKANPGEADQDAADVALMAYVKKFPCSQAASRESWVGSTVNLLDWQQAVGTAAKTLDSA